MGNQPKFDIAKIKRAIIDNTGPGKRYSRRKLSMLASDNKNPDLVRDLISRGQDRKPSFETVVGISQALGVDVSEFIVGASIAATDDEPKLLVVGAVEAGAYREQEQWDEDRQYEVKATPSPFGDTKRFGLQVVGNSMDRIFLPGTILDCFDVYGEDGLRPEPGDIVIVQRKRGDLVETTCKRLEKLADGSFQLRAESNRPEFSDPIPIGKPDNGHFGDEETSVIGIVNAGIMPTLRR